LSNGIKVVEQPPTITSCVVKRDKSGGTTPNKYFQEERQEREAGEDLPSEDLFNSCCITPGMPFMVRLHEHLKFFVRHKMSCDPLWQQIRVVYSGYDVPGEGEHKIMEFIRMQVCSTAPVRFSFIYCFPQGSGNHLVKQDRIFLWLTPAFVAVFGSCDLETTIFESS
jgi:hypothetical protein